MQLNQGSSRADDDSSRDYDVPHAKSSASSSWKSTRKTSPLIHASEDYDIPVSTATSRFNTTKHEHRHANRPLPEVPPSTGLPEVSGTGSRQQRSSRREVPRPERVSVSASPHHRRQVNKFTRGKRTCRPVSVVCACLRFYSLNIEQ